MEIPISMEMLAAGVEAKREAEREKFGEVDIVREIYMAMYGEAIKNYAGDMETFH